MIDLGLAEEGGMGNQFTRFDWLATFREAALVAEAFFFWPEQSVCSVWLT